jgi:hypothetical protein
VSDLNQNMLITGEKAEVEYWDEEKGWIPAHEVIGEKPVKHRIKLKVKTVFSYMTGNLDALGGLKKDGEDEVATGD